MLLNKARKYSILNKSLAFHDQNLNLYCTKKDIFKSKLVGYIKLNEKTL